MALNLSTNVVQSGRRDSNPRISAWKADALPLGDSRMNRYFTRWVDYGQGMRYKDRGEGVEL